MVNFISTSCIKTFYIPFGQPNTRILIMKLGPTHYSHLQLLFFIIILFTCSTGIVLVRGKSDGSSERLLFVFGDSYVDTGNWNPSIASSWKQPYGITFPGKPSGRFSDGRVLTDFVASFLKIRSPVPYERRRRASVEELKFGVNFAYGGTGVYDTDVSQPNMTLQVNLFKDILTKDKIYTSIDLNSSIALVSAGGNDYATFLKHGSPDITLPQFSKSLINQLVLNLELIHSLGVSKIAVSALEPLGCMPPVTLFSAYKNCSKSLNDVTLYHNSLLQRRLNSLNSKIGKPVFFLLDLYSAFLSSFKTHNLLQGPGNLQYENHLKPCCLGITSEYDCGSKVGNEIKYTVCENPESAFFWDTVHPAQNGWHQVYMAVRPTLQTIT